MVKNGCCFIVVFYNIFIDGLSKVGKFSEILVVVRDMFENGWKLDFRIYSLFLFGFCYDGKIDLVLDLWC